VIKYGQTGRAPDTRGLAKVTQTRSVGILTGVSDDAERVARYFEDYQPGTVVDCGSFTLSEAEIIAFARQFDPQPFHVDPVAAKAGPFGGLIASGWHTTGMMMRHLVDHYVSPESSIGSPGVDNIRWPRPVRPGDTLQVRATVVEARRSSSKPDRGIIKTLAELVNQDGDVAMQVTANNFILLRDPAAG
jgi:acyl dehydratase